MYGRSELKLYKTFSLYVMSVAVGTVFSWIVHCTEYDVTAWQYEWPTVRDRAVITLAKPDFEKALW